MCNHDIKHICLNLYHCTKCGRVGRWRDGMIEWQGYSLREVVTQEDVDADPDLGWVLKVANEPYDADRCGGRMR